MQQRGDRTDDFGLQCGDLGEAKRVESVAEQVPAVDLDDELFEVGAAGGVDEAEEAAGLHVGLLRLPV
jgi:hypothetical protein